MADLVLSPDEARGIYERFLPACYSQEFDDCINGRSATFPGCAEINRAYDVDPTPAESLPFCPAPGVPWLELGAGAAAGAALGFVLAKLWR